MDLATFESVALMYWERVPDRFKVGVTALVIEPGAYRNDEFEDGWVYGYCEPDEAVMLLPDAPVQSLITLFYGSFVHISAMTEDFDWHEELWETLTHEIRHHLEWRAGVDHLGDDDDLQDDHERCMLGRPFRPDYHRTGTPLARDVFLGAGCVFLELPLRKKAWLAVAREGASRRWAGIEASIPPVDIATLEGADLVYVPADLELLEGTEDSALPFDEVVLVLRRVRGWFG